MIFKPVVHLTQTLHLYCVKISRITKRTEKSINLSLVTYEYHWVRTKRYLSLWHVWRKQYTYLAPTPTLCPNGPKRDST
jgi:hypothetical protein